MKMRSKIALLALIAAVSVYADTAYDVFQSNKDLILKQPVTQVGELLFSVGKAQSPFRRGDAVGYSKASDSALWNLGEQYKPVAPWPEGLSDEEKEAVWLEFRSQKPDRFSVIGMQQVFSMKPEQDTYLAVLAFPADMVQFDPPQAEELQQALNAVREREKLLLELAQKAAEAEQKKLEAEQKKLQEAEDVKPDPPPRKVYIKDGIEINDSYNEDLML